MNRQILISFVAWLIALYCFCSLVADSQITCPSKECNGTASNLLEYVDLKANPCDDFYEFTCGTFLKKAQIPEGELEISTSTQLDELVIEDLREILENPPENVSYAFEDFTKTYYISCMNTAAITRKMNVPIQLALSRLDDWPVLDELWRQDVTDLTVLMTRLQMFNVEGLFTVYISGAAPSMPMIRQPKLTLQEEDYKFASHRKSLEKLKSLIESVAHLFYYIPDPERVTKEVDELVDLEKKLAKVLLRKDEALTKMSLEEFGAPFKKFQFENIVMHLFNKTKIYMTPEEPVITHHMSYFKALADIVEGTSKRTLVNYLLWRLLDVILPGAPDKFRNLYINFSYDVRGKTIRERPKWCAELIYSYLTEEVDALYISKYRNAVIKLKVNEIAKEVKAATEKIVNQTTWLSKTTRGKIRTKLLNISEMFFNPPQFDSEHIFVEMNDRVEINKDTFLDNILEVRTLITQKNLRHLGIPHDFMMELGVATPSSNYFPLTNTLWISAARISWPLFSETFPMYMNFGGLGFLMAHHIWDAFSNIKNNYNQKNKRMNWRIGDADKFMDMSKCFIEQYDELASNEAIDFVDGTYMLDENIADNGAIRIAFMAYKKWLDKNSPEQGLPNLPYTPEQMFFVNFGRAFCRKTGEKLSLKGLFEKHASRKYRVNPPLMNLEEFSEAFNCPKGSPMNPEKKCRVW